METTLLLLYFIAPPTNAPKSEAKTVWTLQSTSQIQFPTPAACRTIGKGMIAEIKPVVTMTVRAYCLCADGNGKVCVGADELKALTAEAKKPTIEPLGPD